MSGVRPYIPQTGRTAVTPARYKSDHKRRLIVWWREIDRVLLMLIIALMVLGSIAVAAASQASAARLSTSTVTLDEFYFFWAHIRWQVLGIAIMVATSLIPLDLARRVSIVLGGVMLVCLVLVPFIGVERNGALRWLNLGISFQPSEFLKPAFAILVAWVLSWKVRDPNMPVIGISAGLLGLIVILLMAQPDLGSAILFAGCWFVLVLLAGLPMQRIAIMSGLGLGAMVLAYAFYDNARHRIDTFLGGGTAFDHVDLANRTLMGGGWTGTGFGLGTQKMRLPEAHTDYIFSVVGEEFGLLACGVFVILYLAIVLRVLVRLVEEDRLFIILAGTGLIALFGGQAFINILVNLQLFPSKGMTLPLVSYGGSSTVALCFTIGLLLAITRRNPFLSREAFDLRGGQTSSQNGKEAGK